MSNDFKYTAGLHNVGSYQVAGSPYVTASTVSQDTETQIEFPNVTNNVTVKLDSAGGGVTYDSIEMSGTFDFKTKYQPFTLESNESNYSVSLWVSASGTGLSEKGTLWTFGGQDRNMIRERTNKWQFITISQDGNTPSANAVTVPAGWHFLVAVASGSNPGFTGTLYSKLYLNNNAPIASNTACPSNCTPNLAYSNGHFFIGPAAGNIFADTLKFRDLILWSDALTAAQVTTLYNGGLYYEPTSFPVGKKVWVKDDLETQGSHDVPINHADSSNNFTAQNYNAPGDLVRVSSDSPFESEEGGGSGGELRIHYRSTGSLPNVETNKHYWTLSSQDEEIKMNVKTKEIYLSAVDGDCDFSLQADLTNIPASRMYQHTGSGVDE
jgi:hypothetical protein